LTSGERELDVEAPGHAGGNRGSPRRYGIGLQGTKDKGLSGISRKTERRAMMKIVEEEFYEDLCAQFQYEWIRSLRRTLAKYNIPDEVAKNICGEFSFDLSMLFDQGDIVYEGQGYRPVVAFTDDHEEESTLVIHEHGVEFHEYAFGTTADVYESPLEAKISRSPTDT
jgi:hypothetical protein